MDLSQNGSTIMFSTSFDKYPSKPVIASRSAAEAEFRYWLKENNYQTMTDQSGFVWQIIVDVSEGPSPYDRQKPFWDAHIQIKAQLKVERLVATGTLDKDADQRLINLLRATPIPLTLKNMHLTSHSFESLRMSLADTLRQLRKNIEIHSFHDVKRKFCGRWLNNRQLFKHRGTITA